MGSRYWSVRDGAASEAAVVPVPPDGIGLTADEVDMPSADGTRVPLFIVHPREWNRARPLSFLLTDYAACGIDMRPVFSDNLLPGYRPVRMSIDFKGGHQTGSGTQSNVLDVKAVVRAFFRRALLGAR